MKRSLFSIPGAVIFLLLFFLFPCIVLGVEVSEKKDIAIFGVTRYSYNIPDEVLGYTDTSINNVFTNLKRFSVLGYGDYRIKSGDIDSFIEKVREIKARQAVREGTYDQKFGTVVIKAEDFERIVNSFLVVIPSLSSYTVDVERSEVPSGFTTYVVKNYTVDIVIDISFVNVREGKKEEWIRISGSGASGSLDKAAKQAVDGAVSMLSYRIRQIDAFKIKSGVIRVSGDSIYFELGKDLGVRPGDEYQVMSRVKMGKSERTVRMPTGLIRVKKVYPDMSVGRIVMQKEKITEGDQLVEVARLGAQLSLNAGVMKVDIPDMDYQIFLVDDNPDPSDGCYYIDLNQSQKNYAPLTGLRISKNLGYRFKGVLDVGAMLNFPLFGGLGEAGVAASFFFRRLSLDLLAQGGLLYMTTFGRDLERSGDVNAIWIDNTEIEFDDDPVLNIYGAAVGLKGGVSLNCLLKSSVFIRAGVNYRLYTPIKD
ncbi:MAG: hypothetical protein ACOC7U_04850, partial [Spirochaetota bacterium]